MGLSNELSPVRMGVPPTSASTPTGVFSQWFEALFPHAGALGCEVCFAPPPFVLVYLCTNVGSRSLLPAALPAPFSATLSPALSVYLCANVGPQGLLVVGLQACSSHTPPVSVPPRQCESSPPLLPVWMNVYFLFPWCRTPLLFDSLSVLVVQGGAVCLPTPPSWFSLNLLSF